MSDKHLSPKYYRLDSNNRVLPCDMFTFANALETGNNRTVGMTQITSEITVSTVFIGLDHRWRGDGPPLVFETLIFGGPLDGHGQRYSSYDDAEIGHKAWTRKARGAQQKARAEQKQR